MMSVSVAALLAGLGSGVSEDTVTVLDTVPVAEPDRTVSNLKWAVCPAAKVGRLQAIVSPGTLYAPGEQAP